MATRSVIKVEGFTTAQLYKHWDGYPDSTLPWLEKFNREFTEKRGDDKSYKFAQLIRSSVFMQEEFGLDSSTDTGWGVVGYSDNLGQEFEYLLKSDGTVTYRQIE
jgi:hypothetical protein